MIFIPFSGSKRNSYKKVKEITTAGEYKTVYEPFGGSCVLSVNLFNDRIVNNAVVNDYDRFFDSYPEYLNYKDWIVEECLNHGIKPRKGRGKIWYWIDNNGIQHPVQRKLNNEEITFLQSLMKQVPERLWKYFGYNFAFSAVSSHKKIRLCDFTYFTCDLTTTKQRKYLKILDQLTIEHLDYKDFISKYSNQIDKSSLLIVDPPYTGTAQDQYKTQFTDEQTQQLINSIVELDCDFIFFNHNKEKVENWLDGLNYSIKLVGNSSTTANRNRKDVMAYVVKDKRKLKKEQQLSYLDGINQ